MAKQPSYNYDDYGFDERPRVCGGAVFVKLIKKGRCRSAYSKDRDGPFLTSSSSSSSSLSGDEFSKQIYDASKPQYCMPRQVEEVGKLSGTYQRDSSKLDFNIRVKDPIIRIVDQKNFSTTMDSDVSESAEEHALAQSIIQFDPNMINELKARHLRTRNGIQDISTPPEIRQDMFAVSMRDGKEHVEERETIDSSWNEANPISSNREAPRVRQSPRSKVRGMRREVSSFRKELDAVKRSLPSQRRSIRQSEEAHSWQESSPIPPMEHLLPVDETSYPHEEEGHDQNDVWNKIDQMFALKEEDNDTFYGIHNKPNEGLDHDDVWKEPSSSIVSKERQQQEPTDRPNKTYFKNEWNFAFKETENDRVDVANQVGNEESAPNDGENHVEEDEEPNTAQSNECPTTRASGPEITATTSLENEIATESSSEYDSETPVEESATSSSNRNTLEPSVDEEAPSKESEIRRTDKERLKSIHKFLLEQQKIEQERVGSDICSIEVSNYEQDLELVQRLLKKYGDEDREKPSSPKRKQVNYSIEAPTDAWFHRHAAGSQKTSERSPAEQQPVEAQEEASVSVDEREETPRTTKDEVDEREETPRTTKDEATSRSPAPSEVTKRIPPTAKIYTKPPVSPKKANRVRFAEHISTNERTHRTPMSATKPSPKSVGKLTAKIQFWETNEKMRNME